MEHCYICFVCFFVISLPFLPLNILLEFRRSHLPTRMQYSIHLFRRFVGFGAKSIHCSLSGALRRPALLIACANRFLKKCGLMAFCHIHTRAGNAHIFGLQGRRLVSLFLQESCIAHPFHNLLGFLSDGKPLVLPFFIHVLHKQMRRSHRKAVYATHDAEHRPYDTPGTLNSAVLMDAIRKQQNGASKSGNYLQCCVMLQLNFRCCQNSKLKVGMGVQCFINATIFEGYTTTQGAIFVHSGSCPIACTIASTLGQKSLPAH